MFTLNQCENNISNGSLKENSSYMDEPKGFSSMKRNPRVNDMDYISWI